MFYNTDKLEDMIRNQYRKIDSDTLEDGFQYIGGYNKPSWMGRYWRASAICSLLCHTKDTYADAQDWSETWMIRCTVLKLHQMTRLYVNEKFSGQNLLKTSLRPDFFVFWLMQNCWQCRLGKLPMLAFKWNETKKIQNTWPPLWLDLEFKCGHSYQKVEKTKKWSRTIL